MNEKDSYLKFKNEICKYCVNRKDDLCCIKIRQDKTTYCENYKKDEDMIKEIEKYKKIKIRTAPIEKSIMRFWI